jgi:hypothetical protein
MATQVSAGSVTNPQFLDGGRIMKSALFQIPCTFRTSMQLQPIESSRLLQQIGIGSRRQFLRQIRDTLSEGARLCSRISGTGD